MSERPPITTTEYRTLRDAADILDRIAPTAAEVVRRWSTAGLTVNDDPSLARCLCGHNLGWHRSGLAPCAFVEGNGDVCGCDDFAALATGEPAEPEPTDDCCEEHYPSEAMSEAERAAHFCPACGAYTGGEPADPPEPEACVVTTGRMGFDWCSTHGHRADVCPLRAAAAPPAAPADPEAER